MPPAIFPAVPATTYTVPRAGPSSRSASGMRPIASGRPLPPSFFIAALNVAESP